MKININTLRKRKENNEPVTWITAYDYPQARIVDKAGIDMILVGDSAGNTTHGYESTIPMTMDKMIIHAEAVSRGATNAFLVGDMPYMSYQSSNELAVENAGRFIRAGMDAIKLEGVMPDRVKAIDEAGILVAGHLGLTPQNKAKLGGYRVQGKTKKDAEIVLEQALQLQEAGCAILLLEAMPPEPAKNIAKTLEIPVYGIGAGNEVDGQLLIFHDVVGLSFDFKCKFAKQYIDTEQLWTEAITDYVNDIKTHNFPSQQHFYESKE